MNVCHCNRLYNMSKPNVINEYAFSGSLCRVREFETADGIRFCLTIFSLSDYKHLHFPHDEYKWLISKLHACISPDHAIFQPLDKTDVLSLEQITIEGDLKVKFEGYKLFIGSLTARGLLNSSPFSKFYSEQFRCNMKWDICICKTCPVFIRLSEFEASAQRIFAHRKSNNIIFTRNVE